MGDWPGICGLRPSCSALSAACEGAVSWRDRVSVNVDTGSVWPLMSLPSPCQGMRFVKISCQVDPAGQGRLCCCHAHSSLPPIRPLPDMLALQCQPEWPAANVMLRLFAKALSGPKVGLWAALSLALATLIGRSLPAYLCNLPAARCASPLGCPTSLLVAAPESRPGRHHGHSVARLLCLRAAPCARGLPTLTAA